MTTPHADRDGSEPQDPAGVAVRLVETTRGPEGYMDAIQSLTDAARATGRAEATIRELRAEVARLQKYAPSPAFAALLESSSFGSAEVKALRDTVSNDAARSIVMLAREMERAEVAEAALGRVREAVIDHWDSGIVARAVMGALDTVVEEVGGP